MVFVAMETVTLSNKYHLVLPRGTRERLRLCPGTKFTVLDKGRSGLPRARAPHARRPRYDARREHSRPAREERPLLILIDSSGWIEYLAHRSEISAHNAYTEALDDFAKRLGAGDLF